MPTISGTTAVLAGQENTNVLLGSQYDQMPFDGTIEIGIVSDRQDTTVAIFSGPDVLQEPGGLCAFSGAAGGGRANVIYPDHFSWEDEAAQGDRLKITVRNPNAGTATISWVLRITAS